MNVTLVDPIMIGLQLLFGFIVKRVPWLKSWPNKLIPVFNYVIGLLTSLITFAPVNAAESGGIQDTWWFRFVYVLFNTIMSTGTHSTAKNLTQAVKGGTHA